MQILLILAMITSARSTWPSDVAIRDRRRPASTSPCRVRLKLFTLADALILRKLGALSKRDGEAVADALARSLAPA